MCLALANKIPDCLTQTSLFQTFNSFSVLSCLQIIIIKYYIVSEIFPLNFEQLFFSSSKSYSNQSNKKIHQSTYQPNEFTVYYAQCVYTFSFGLFQEISMEYAHAFLPKMEYTIKIKHVKWICYAVWRTL